MTTEKAKENADKLRLEKLKALESTLGNIEKTYGKGSIMKLGDDAIEKIESISTGSIGLDFALGVGGLPKGRVVEIYGRKLRQNNAGLACDCRGSKTGRNRCFY